MNRYRNLYCILAVGLFSAISYGLSGTGTAEDPYRIQSLEDFNEISADPNSTFIDAHIRLDCDLDLIDLPLYGPWIEDFTGVFDGNNHTILKLRIEAMMQEQVGLFGYASGARIVDLILIDPYVSGLKQVAAVCGYADSCTIDNCRIAGMSMLAHRFAGGIVGEAYRSTVTGCSVSGEITGYKDTWNSVEPRYIGGLIGYCSNAMVVEDCGSNITIKPYPSHKIDSAGGLIGDLGEGTVRRSSSISNITGASYVGGLLGESIRPANLVEDCFVQATVSGGENVGGLIGRNGNADSASNAGGTVLRCSSKSTVQCGNIGGGLIGRNYSGPIRLCQSDSSVSGGLNVGGLVGSSGTATIQECRSNSTVSGTQYVGGLIGVSASATIQECRSNSTVSGTQYVGGLMGQCGATVSDCLALGTATSTSTYRGGLMGKCNGGTTTRCYAAVDLPGSTTIRGGLFGRIESTTTVSRCFWDKSIQTGGITADYGTKSATVTITDIFGKTTAEMMTEATFTAYGWDFANETANGTADFWRLCTDGTAYPRLAWEFPRQDLACPDGVGVEDLLILSTQWLVSGLTANSGPDFTGDGSVTLDDLAVLSAVWLKTP
jgi:hypothetical protein